MSARIVAWGDDERRLTDSVSVLCGPERGAYPSGNSVVVRGRAENVIIDPSISVVGRGGAPVAIDAVLNSHCHEDHMAGNGLFADARLHIHDQDLVGATSLEGLLAGYGFEDSMLQQFASSLIEEFHFSPRPDAHGFADGARFDLGGVVVEAVHLPGHTAGHSGFRIDDEVFFLADIDLTGFGPYYGDVWSDLDQFENSLARVRDEDARWYVTFHHKGIVEGRERFVELLDAFVAVIHRRHAAMLEYLSEPRRLEDLVAHRFIYRPSVDSPIVEPVERRSAQLHLARMLARSEAVEVGDGYVRRA
jgi:glyoxylase-like metal-dependent hydrolase (beta-lactamase superfamily II)